MSRYYQAAALCVRIASLAQREVQRLADIVKDVAGPVQQLTTAISDLGAGGSPVKTWYASPPPQCLCVAL